MRYTWLRSSYLAVIITTGSVVIAVSAVRLAAEPIPPTWVVLALLTLITGWVAVRLPSPVSVSLSDTFTMTAALLFGPAAGTLLAGADGFIMSLRLPREYRTATRVLFNMAAAGLSMWLAASFFYALVSPRAPIGRIVLPLALFGATYFLLNTGLVAGALVAGRRADVHQVWRDLFLPFWLTYGVATLFAGVLVAAAGAGFATMQTFLLAVPAILVASVGLKYAVDRFRRRHAQHVQLRSYESALRSTADAVLLTKADGRVAFMNAAAERLTGLTEAEARGRLLDDVFRLQQSDSQRLDLTVVGEGVLGEYTLVRNDGTTIPIEEMHTYIRDEDERIGGMIRTFRDITRRREAEQERRALLLREQAARTAADSANRAKDEFLATLSHELRTPAAAMIGWTELLKGGRLDSERSQKALAALDRSARAQAAVLSDLLDVSRIVRGIMRLDVRRTSLPDVINEAIDTIEPAVIAKRLQVRTAIAPDITIIDADPDRLRQILWNLLSNAVKFTPEGGWVEVEAAWEGTFIRIRVSDSGRGMDPDFLPFAFDRFRQAEPTVTRSHGGLGLGLAIVQHLVHLHGWTVEASSEGPGRGAQFTIRVPSAVRRRQDDR